MKYGFKRSQLTTGEALHVHLSAGSSSYVVRLILPFMVQGPVQPLCSFRLTPSPDGGVNNQTLIILAFMLSVQSVLVVPSFAMYRLL